VNNHHRIVEGEQEATIEAFLVAHEDHTPEVEIQQGTWSIYCHCKRCGEIHTYEVDNEARQQALGLPLWQEDKGGGKQGRTGTTKRSGKQGKPTNALL
jgi:hypothetical protein